MRKRQRNRGLLYQPVPEARTFLIDRKAIQKINTQRVWVIPVTPPLFVKLERHPTEAPLELPDVSFMAGDIVVFHPTGMTNYVKFHVKSIVEKDEVPGLGLATLNFDKKRRGNFFQPHEAEIFW